MVLDLSQIRAITCGAERVEQRADGLYFYRMTQQQLEIYRESNPAFYRKALANAGICLSFMTDSPFLHLDLSILTVMNRSYGTVEVLSDGVPIGNINNHDHMQLPRSYARLTYPEIRRATTFDLGEGSKHITVLFPRLAGVLLHSLSLTDGAMLIPVKPSKKLLVYGDSITQGFDCLRPSSHYVYRLAAALDAEEYNKGIGGEKHTPALVACDETFSPDYILVAYGTNDWAYHTPQMLQHNCSEFYRILREKYPDVPVITITPVWRANEEKLSPTVHFDSFHDIEACIRRTTASYKNITVVRGYDLIPHDLIHYGDYGLHPSDLGFAHYSKNLLQALQDQGFLKKA